MSSTSTGQKHAGCGLRDRQLRALCEPRQREADGRRVSAIRLVVAQDPVALLELAAEASLAPLRATTSDPFPPTHANVGQLSFGVTIY